MHSEAIDNANSKHWYMDIFIGFVHAAVFYYSSEGLCLPNENLLSFHKMRLQAIYHFREYKLGGVVYHIITI